MRVKVAYSGQARFAAGCATEEMEFSAASTLRTLLDEIVSRHGDHMAALLEFKQRSTPSVLVFVGEDQVSWEAPPVLNDGDEIMLVAPIAGG
jgi:molybdopterin converting factor small subunit